MIRVKKQAYYNGLDYINDEVADGVYVNNRGDLFWYRNGRLHRDNGQPAIIYINGKKEWFKNGMRYYI
jgi:hypothetical protein